RPSAGRPRNQSTPPAGTVHTAWATACTAKVNQWFAAVCRHDPPPLWSAAPNRHPCPSRTRHPLVDIFDEIDEELRAERAQRLLKRYAPHLIALVVLIVAA